MKAYARRRRIVAALLLLFSAYSLQGTSAFNSVDVDRAVSADVVTDPAGYLGTPVDYTCWVPDTGGGSCSDDVYNYGTTPLMFNHTSSKSGSLTKCDLVSTPGGTPGDTWINPGSAYTISFNAGIGLADENSCVVTITVTADKAFVFQGGTEYRVTVKWSDQ